MSMDNPTPPAEQNAGASVKFEHLVPVKEPRPLHEWASFDPLTDIVTIYDMKFAREILRSFATSPIGFTFKIIERHDGVLTISQERNALEAAAPDMLNALKASRIYVETLERHLNPVTDPGAPTIREHGAMVRAAIAKAEGTTS